MGDTETRLNNRYRLDKKIGEGGVANVFLATDLELGRQVAVKVMEQNWANDRELLADFRNQARTIASLDHPNILAIYDFGVANGAPYIVMPYVSGGSFVDRMKQGPFTLDEIGFYLSQIGSALDYAHQHNIIHGDIKPSNFLIRSRKSTPDRPDLLLADFGIARFSQGTINASKTIRGTPKYMAPEQWRGTPVPATDQYALAIVAYELLTSRSPFLGTQEQVMYHHLLTPPQPPSSVNSRISPAIDAVILRALSKNPDDRYPTCQALTAAYYKALLTDKPPGVSLPQPPQARPRETVEDRSVPTSLPAPSLYSDHTVIAPNLPLRAEPEESLQSTVRSPIPTSEPSPLASRQQLEYSVSSPERRQEASDQTMLSPAGLQPRELAGEHLQFTAFHPRVVPVETWTTLLVYAYIESALQAIRADAAKFKDELGATPGTVDAWALSPLARGTQITIVPTCQGITFNPPSLSFTWVEDWHQAKFRFQADRRWTGLTATGEIIIRADLIIIATVKISLRFVEQSLQPPPRDSRNTAEAPAYLFGRVFTSYSHADTPVVLACRNTYKSLGLDVLIDIDTLRSGENWNPALMRMIDNADLFQLFWSERSAQSPYVNQEWRYALQHYKGEGFIRPVYWENPLVPPPRELSHLHFDYIELPRLEPSAAPNPIPMPVSRKKILLKPPRLLVTTEPDKGFRATFELTGETMTLGRATDNTLCLTLSIISRYHAVLHRLNSESQELTYKIVQKQSINPMRFNGETVGEKVLEDGDIIEIGKRGYAEYIVKLTYQAPEYGFV